MPFDARAQRDPREDPLNDPLQKTSFVREGNFRSPDILQQFPNLPSTDRSRQLLVWRVPRLGFVPMYINPQQLQIQERKIIQKQRTKGGYVIQYWGEELTTISISGTTGSSGIEGINILRDVYRAEQNAFEQVSKKLADRLQAFSVGGTLSNLVSAAAGGTTQNTANAIAQAGASLFGTGANPPLLPTLGSLAVSAELFHQGWVFKGYFQDFSIDEGVTNGVGVFNYRMTYIVLDRRGTRNNFMSWHRKPAELDPESGLPNHFYAADANSVPPNFGGEGE